MQISTETTRVKTSTVSTPGFDQIAQGLKSAIDDFSEDRSSKFSMIVSALMPIRAISLRALTFTSRYVRLHPVQTTIGIVALGFLAAQLMKSKATPRSSDDRQY